MSNLTLNKRQIKPNGQYIMDNPERLVTLGTQDEDKENSSEHKRRSNTDPQISEDEPRCSIIIITTVKIIIIDMLSDINLF
jgi:hypothetical protein